MKTKCKSVLSILLVSSCGLATSLPVYATTFSAAADFSATNNPNGVWSYGSVGNTSAPFGPFQGYTNSANVSGLDVWYSSLGEVVHNGTNSPITSGPNTWQPGELSLVNLAVNQASEVRFTAPGTGNYSIFGSFHLGNSIGSSDVGIGKDYDSQFSANNQAVALFGFAGLTGTVPFSLNVNLSQGETIDFGVGGGITGLDNTVLNATIDFTPSVSVPEPATITLVILGLASFACGKRHKST